MLFCYRPVTITKMPKYEQMYNGWIFQAGILLLSIFGCRGLPDADMQQVKSA